MSFLDGFLIEQAEEKGEESSSKPTPNAGGIHINEEEKQKLQSSAAEKIREIYDPEIPVNIYELGLIYDIEFNEFADAIVTMTLTSPNCPVAEILPGEVEMKVREVEGIGDVHVNLVFEPPWDMSMMSEAARLEMGFMQLKLADASVNFFK